MRITCQGPLTISQAVREQAGLITPPTARRRSRCRPAAMAMAMSGQSPGVRGPNGLHKVPLAVTCTLVHSCILIDVLDDDLQWCE